MDESGAARFIAMVVRNAIEDFHAKHLTDEQMSELNPLIRNATYTALYALSHAHDDPIIRYFVGFNTAMIPDYWEAPELTASFRELLDRGPGLMGRKGDAPV